MSVNHQARWQNQNHKAASASMRALAPKISGVLCFGVAFSLLVMGKVEPDATQRARLALSEFATETAAFLATPMQSLHQASERLKAWQQAVEENRRLRLELQALHALRAQRDELATENNQLRALQHVSRPEAPVYLTARVVSLAGGSTQQSIWVNAGEEEGVRVNMAAMAPEGLIGRVLEVGPHTARILLLTDALSRLPVQTGQSRFRAIAAGTEGSGLLNFRHLPPHAALVAQEMVLTAGDGHLLPVGVPVGLVEAVQSSPPAQSEHAAEAGMASEASDFDGQAPVQWRIRPLVDLARLDMISLIQLPSDIPSPSPASTQP